MSWPVVTLDSIKADVPYACVGGPFGSNLTSKHYVDEGVPVIRGQNLGGPGCFNEAGFVFVTPEKADKLRPNLAFRGDLLFTQRGTLGQVGLIPQDSQYERYVVSQSQMKLTVDANRVDARFVYQYFRLPSTIQEILNRTITAGVPHINLGILKAFEIPLPPLSIQRAIAEVAQTYDDLIATNQRRIALLEDAARRLYREWFVHLRFPGHESVPVMGVLPVGWRRMTLGELCAEVPSASVQTGPFGSQLHQHDYKPDGVPVVMPQDIVGDRIRQDRISYVDESTAARLARHALQPLDIVFPRRGDIAKRALVEAHQAGYLCGTGCLKISLPLEPLHPLVLYFQLADPIMVKWIEGQAVGATMLNLSASILKAVSCLVPSLEVQSQFVAFVSGIRSQIDVMEREIATAVQARDLLLPKLMSGQLDVSGIRLPDEVAA